MKTEFIENEWGTSFTMTPETPEEAAQLMRFTASSKREIPNVYFSFSNKPFCSVDFRKKEISKQYNSISNDPKP